MAKLTFEDISETVKHYDDEIRANQTRPIIEGWHVTIKTAEALADVLICSQRLRDYIIMVRDNVFPNILLVCPDDKPVRAIMRDALKQLEDM